MRFLRGIKFIFKICFIACSQNIWGNELFYVNINEGLPSVGEMRRNCIEKDNPSQFPYCLIVSYSCEAIYVNSTGMAKGDFQFSTNKPDSSLVLLKNSIQIAHLSLSKYGNGILRDFSFPATYRAFAIKQYSNYGNISSSQSHHPRKFRPEIVVFDLSLSKDKEKIRFDFPKNYIQLPLKFSGFDNNSEVSLKIGNTLVQTFSTSNQEIVLLVTEGIIPFTFEYSSFGQTFSFHKDIVVKKNGTSPLDIFQKYFAVKKLQKIYFDKKFSEKLSYHFDNPTHFLLLEALLLEEGGRVHDFSKKITANSKEAKFNDAVTAQEVDEIIKRSPLSHLRITGQCQNATLGEINHTVDVFSAANSEGTKIGVLEISDNKFINTKEVKFINHENVATKVSASFEGNCLGKDMLGFGAKKQEGSRVQLGVGPWGEKAWIDGVGHSIFSGIVYHLPKQGAVTLEGITNKGIEISPVGTDEVEVIPIDLVFEKSGKARYQFSCRR